MTQPLWVILCCLPERGEKRRVEETGAVSRQHSSPGIGVILECQGAL